MDKYKAYKQLDTKTSQWIDTILANYLKNNTEDQTEVEHILDFMTANNPPHRPERYERMSYKEAKIAAQKWVDTLKKQGADIEESPEDTEVVLDYGDGMKMVKLVGDNAYKREGSLMSHCVGSYTGSDKIYSLRDKDNMPHATIEMGNQIKGKGNGSIHPKYVDYIVRFLESNDIEMASHDMRNIGYISLDNDEERALYKKAKEQGIVKGELYRERYMYTW